MATQENFVDFVVEQIDNAGLITTRKMFGEYAIYSDGIIFGFICNNKLFVKPTEPGRNYIGDDLVEAPPYPKGKPSILIEEQIEDRDWISGLVRVTAKELIK